MKKKNKLIAVALLLLLLPCFHSCRKIIEPDQLPEQDPRLVVNCVVYRDSIVKVNLSSSKSILSGKDYKLIDNAACDLYIDDNFAEHMSNYKDGNYKSVTVAKAGKKYSIKASAQGYSTVQGNSTMPDSVLNFRFERYDTTNYHLRRFNSQYYKYIGGSLKYKLYLRDRAAEDNYYNVQPYIILLDSLNNVIPFKTQPTIMLSDNSGLSSDVLSGATLDFDDKGIVSGGDILMDVEIALNIEKPVSPSAYSAQVFLVVSSLSADMYKYEVTRNQQATSGSGSPLFAEPVIVHNNISNGMGIVGCVNQKQVSLGILPVREN